MPPDAASQPPTAYAYIRVSHRNSAQSGLSAGAQLDMCYRYYQYRLEPNGVLWWGLTEIPRGLTLTSHRSDVALLYDPATSARQIPLLKRPGGKRLGQLLKRGDHVIFAHLDRGFRAVLDHSALVQMWLGLGIHIHYADLNVDLETPNGMLVANIMAAVAQGQSDLISQRQKEKFRRMKREGRPCNGWAPLGWKIVGRGKKKRFEPNWETRAYMAEIVRLHDEEGVSFRAIGRLLNRYLCDLQDLKFIDSAFSGHRVWKFTACRKAYRVWKEMLAEDPSVAEHPEVVALRGAIDPELAQE